MFAEGKKLIGVTVGEGILPLIHSHRNTKLPAILQKLQQKPVLHRGETGKAIQHHSAVFQHFRPLHLPA